MSHLLTLIVVLPLVGFVLNGGLRQPPRQALRHRRRLRPADRGVPADDQVLPRPAGAGGAPLIETAYTWARIGGRSFEIAFYFDRLSAVMALIVTGVGSVIHIYSIGYMHDDKSYARFFAYLNLFLFFMLLARARPVAAGAVRRLGRRGARVVPADRLLVRGPGQRARRQEGVRHQPHRRRRLPARHVPAVLGVRHARHGQDQRRVHQRRGAGRSRRASPASCCSSAPPASRRRFRCTSGCPTRWRARRRCRR